ncbi:MAG: hypothetical protein ACOZCL_02445 [Bacillota bacterium]
MQENIFQNDKSINIKETLTKGWSLYKNNFKLFISINLILYLVTFLFTMPSFLTAFSPNPVFAIIYGVSALVLFIPLMYFTIRFTVALYVAIHARYKNEHISFGMAYTQAKGRLLNYFIATIVIGLINLIPSMALFYGMTYVENIFTKLIIYAVAVVPMIYITVILGFGPIIRIFNPEIDRYLIKSKELVKGNFWKVLIIVFCSSIVFMIPKYLFDYVVKEFFAMPLITQQIIDQVYMLLMVIISPFGTSTYISMFMQLMGEDRADESEAEEVQEQL